MNRVLSGIKQLDGAEIPIARNKGQFQIEIDVPDQEVQPGTWKSPKKAGKQSQSDKMELDFVGKNRFEPLKEMESSAEGFQRLLNTM